VAYSAAAEAELTSVVGNEGADVAGNIDEGCDAVASTRLKRSLSGSFSDDDLMTQRSSKTSRCSDNHSRRATGNRVKSYIENSDFMNFHFLLKFMNFTEFKKNPLNFILKLSTLILTENHNHVPSQSQKVTLNSDKSDSSHCYSESESATAHCSSCFNIVHSLNIL